MSLVQYLDDDGVTPIRVTEANPLPTTGAGGGGGSISATVNEINPTYAEDDSAPLRLDTEGKLYSRAEFYYNGSPINPEDPSLVIEGGREYETIAASQTAQVLGTTGAIGDVLDGLLVIPASVSPGVVTILDNATSINVFAGGGSSLSNLVPFYIPLGLSSVSGAWKVTTGASVSVVAVGDFT